MFLMLDNKHLKAELLEGERPVDVLAKLIKEHLNIEYNPDVESWVHPRVYDVDIFDGNLGIFYCCLIPETIVEDESSWVNIQDALSNETLTETDKKIFLRFALKGGL